MKLAQHQVLGAPKKHPKSRRDGTKIAQHQVLGAPKKHPKSRRDAMKIAQHKVLGAPKKHPKSRRDAMKIAQHQVLVLRRNTQVPKGRHEISPARSAGCLEQIPEVPKGRLKLPTRYPCKGDIRRVENNNPPIRHCRMTFYLRLPSRYRSNFA